MRLATIRAPGGATRLMAAAPDGSFFDVRAAAHSGASRLEGVVDVGSLYRAGSQAIALVRQLAADPGSSARFQALDDLSLAPPVVAPASIVCIGRNYMEHIREGAAPLPEFPVLFSKFPSALVAHREPVVRSHLTSQLDYEGELGVIVGTTASHVTEEAAWEHVAGYTIFNDISARDLQLGDLQWIRGKSLDTFAPMGPIFVSADEIRDVGALAIRTWVNGDLRQEAPISDMVFSIPQLLAFITEGITLQPGDVIATGTPGGTAFGMRPPAYLSPGDVVEVEVTSIGRLRSPIVGAE